MRRIEAAFAETFAEWDIALPAGNVARRERGTLFRDGWTIQYCFGSDSRGEFLDYYASHRMTDDSHVRLYANGDAVTLPSIVSMYIVPPDPAAAKEAQSAYLARNREIAALMAAKGFALDINATLRSGLVGDG